MKRTILAGSAAAIATFALVGPASAAVLVNDNGTGFVGKGDVQTAMGWNDATLQKNASKVSAISIARSATQALSSSATQTATQAGTQSATQEGTQTGVQSISQTAVREVSCTVTTNEGKKSVKVRYNDGYRTGTRSATRTGTRTGFREATRDAYRTGTRTGSRSGTQSGTQAAAVAFELRNNKNGAVTGFNLTGYTNGPTTTYGTPSFGDPVFVGDYTYESTWTTVGEFEFGDYSFGDYDFQGATLDMGEYTWGGWVALEKGSNPADCLRNDNKGVVTDLSDVITEGEVVGGDIVDGDIVDGDIVDGEIVPVGDPVEGGVTFGETQYGTVTYGAFGVTGVTLRP